VLPLQHVAAIAVAVTAIETRELADAGALAPRGAEPPPT